MSFEQSVEFMNSSKIQPDFSALSLQQQQMLINEFVKDEYLDKENGHEWEPMENVDPGLFYDLIFIKSPSYRTRIIDALKETLEAQWYEDFYEDVEAKYEIEVRLLQTSAEPQKGALQ